MDLEKGYIDKKKKRGRGARETMEEEGKERAKRMCYERLRIQKGATLKIK